MQIHTFINDIPADFTISGDIAIDTETMGLNLQRDRLCLLQFCQESRNSNNIEDNDVFLVKFQENSYDCPNLKKLLTNNNQKKIFHFARFDLAAIQLYLNVKIENIFCTKIASRLVRTYTEYHSLKELCRELLGVQLSKQQQSTDWGANHLSHEQKEYAARDVIYLHRIRDILEALLERENRLTVAQKIFDFLPIRVGLDLSGWHNTDIFSH